MPGYPVVQSGNYLMEIDTGYDWGSFTLDDATKGILAGYTTTTTRTNLVTNPNFELDTTGWGSGQSNGVTTFVRSNDYAVVGTYSGKLTTTGTSGNINVNFGFPTVTPSTTYSVSTYVRSNASFTQDLFVNGWTGIGGTGTSLGVQGGPSSVTSISSGWTRNTLTFTTGSTCNSVQIVNRWNGANIAGNIFYIDAVLFERSSSVLPYFDGTYANDYTGYTLTAQQWNGTADASTSKTTWGSNSSYLTSNYSLGPNVTYADVTDGVLSVRVMRGRRDIGDQFTYGTMSFVLNNTKAQGAFAPFDTTSPYYDPANSQPGLAPLRNVRLSRYDQSNNQVFLFVGKIVDYNLTYNLGGIDTVSVVCADDFYILAQTYLNEWTTTEELASVRMDAMLSLPEVNYPTGVTHRNIQTSQTTLGGGGPYKVNKGTSVATYANEINKAEQGRVFVSRSGVFTFEPRIGNTLSGSVADFHDDGTNIKYNGVGVKFEATQVCNYASVTTLQGGTAQVAQDTASQAKYLTQTQYITNSLLHNDAGALALANYLIVGEPEARFSDLETEYLMMTATQRDTVSTIDIGDTITIQKQIQTGPTTYTQFAQELSVEGLEFNINFSRGHNVTFYTAPTTVVFQLILDSATYGTLDALNVLG